jgi:predicted DsbA family dithiol-disulfide isomerase
MVHDDIGRQCAEVGLPFRPPTLVPNSRRALETAEVVRATAPDRFVALDDALFTAHFVDGRNIGDPVVIDELVDRVGCHAATIRAAVEEGAGQAAITAAKALALDHGVAGTPAWLFGDELVIPGVQPRELFERVVDRLGSSRLGEAAARPNPRR